MNKYFLFLSSLLFGVCAFGQVGIGTTTPTPGYGLDVKGSLLIQTDFKVNAFNSKAIDVNDKFILKRHNSNPPGEVVRMDMTQLDVAPINVINYHFKNVYRDNLNSVNLQFDASKYVVGLANVRYTGDPIQKGQIGTNYSNIGNFMFRTFVPENGTTWHLEIQNKTLDAPVDSDIQYYVTLIIYDKKYFRELPSISVDFNGEVTGSASKPNGL